MITISPLCTAWLVAQGSCAIFNKKIENYYIESTKSLTKSIKELEERVAGDAYNTNN